MNDNHGLPSILPADPRMHIQAITGQRNALLGLIDSHLEKCPDKTLIEMYRLLMADPVEPKTINLMDRLAEEFDTRGIQLPQIEEVVRF